MQSSLYLALAIVTEIAGTLAMKFSDGLTRLVPTVAIFICYGISFAAFAVAISAIIRAEMAK